MSSPPTPPPLDDGGLSPGGTDHDATLDGAPADGRRGGRHRGRHHEPTRESTHDREPNYLVRRAIAIGLVVAVLAGGSVVAGRIIGSRGDDDSKAKSGAAWNTVVVVADDEIRLVDPKTGDVTTTYPGQEPMLAAESLVTGHTLILMNDFGRITELDLRDGTIRRSSAVAASTLHASSENRSIVLAGPPVGGDVAVVDTRVGTAFDIGDAASLTDPLMFANQVLVNRSASHIATADARTFQSVLVEVETQTPTLLAGQVVALNNDTVVTAQRAGDRAELEFYDLQGDRRGSVDTPTPQVTMLTGESTALIVTADGAIASVSAKGSVDELGVIGGPVTGDATAVQVLGGVAAMDSTRLLVATGDGVVLLDRDGAVLADTPGELLSPVGRASACALIGSTRPAGTASQLDLETGEVLGEVAGGLVGSVSADGCTAAMIGDAPRMVADGIELDLGTTTTGTTTTGTTTGSITIAPDGSAYILSTSTGERLVTLAEADGDEPAAPITVANGPVLIRFAEV